jgi:hypothetical protein
MGYVSYHSHNSKYFSKHCEKRVWVLCQGWRLFLRARALGNFYRQDGASDSFIVIISYYYIIMLY